MYCIDAQMLIRSASKRHAFGLDATRRRVSVMVCTEASLNVARTAEIYCICPFCCFRRSPMMVAHVAKSLETLRPYMSLGSGARIVTTLAWHRWHSLLVRDYIEQTYHTPSGRLPCEEHDDSLMSATLTIPVSMATDPPLNSGFFSDAHHFEMNNCIITEVTIGF